MIVFMIMTVLFAWPDIRLFMLEVDPALFAALPDINVFNMAAERIPALQGYDLAAAIPGLSGLVEQTGLPGWITPNVVAFALPLMILALLTYFSRSCQRFHREVKAVAKLSHPHIVTAHDADEAKGVHFLVMEHVSGHDLGRLVKKHGVLPPHVAADCVLQAARGLEYAHQKGIVHRDIKPSNLLLDEEGVVKVLDLGLARIDAGNLEEQSELTGTGIIMGTLDYMSPEQALDTKHADARSDIYSLGATLHYLLTGRGMLEGDTRGKKMRALLAETSTETVSLSTHRSDVPAELEQVFQRMVTRNPDQRYQTMSEVIADLQRFVPGTESGSQTVTFAAGSGSFLPSTGNSLSSDSGLKRFVAGLGSPTTLVAPPITEQGVPDTFQTGSAEATKVSPTAEAVKPPLPFNAMLVEWFPGGWQWNPPRCGSGSYFSRRLL